MNSNKKIIANEMSELDFNEVECRTSASTSERVESDEK